jgi:glycosyltransferase involved in cell wall biosynthesis
MKCNFEDILRVLFSRVPLRASARQRLKAYAFKHFPFLLGNTFAYKQWASSNNYHSDVADTLPDEESLEALNQRYRALGYTPLVSIIMPTYNSPRAHLISAIESVISQIYDNWELCICDDGSKDDTVSLLMEVARQDERIKVKRLKENRGISSATNSALEMASGEYIALLDHDDLLTVNALLEVVALINDDKGIDIIYSDQDKVDEKGNLSSPFFKPDWSPELFLGVMYVGHLLVVRRETALAVGGFRQEFDKVQDYEFMLRISEQTNKIRHISKIMYHWRMIEGSLAYGLNQKNDIDELQAAAVNAHLTRLGVPAKAEANRRHRHRVICKPLPRDSHPKVSVIIPTKDAPDHIQRCLASIYEKTTYRNFEVVVVDNGTVDKRALQTLNSFPVKVIPFNQAFNFSVANNIGVNGCDGEIVVLLNNDTEVVTPDWLEILLFYLYKDNVGIVGPMLTYPDRTVQHAGVVLGFRGTADHIMRGFPRESDGYAGSLSCAREVSAVTGACLMIRKDDYDRMGGLVEYYATHYQDVDLCLRVISKGKRIICVPQVELIHYESVSRKAYYDLVDRALLLDSWGDLIAAHDPYYNINFSLEHTDYSLRER